MNTNNVYEKHSHPPSIAVAEDEVVFAEGVVDAIEGDGEIAVLVVDNGLAIFCDADAERSAFAVALNQAIKLKRAHINFILALVKVMDDIRMVFRGIGEAIEDKHIATLPTIQIIGPFTAGKNILPGIAR